MRPSAFCGLAVTMAAVCVGGGCVSLAPPTGPRMQSIDPAERVRAIGAAASSDDKSALPALIDRLDDEEPVVRFAAINALSQITGQRFGFRAGADEQARGVATARWRRFMRQQAAKSGHVNARPSP